MIIIVVIIVKVHEIKCPFYTAYIPGFSSLDVKALFFLLVIYANPLTYPRRKLNFYTAKDTDEHIWTKYHYHRSLTLLTESAGI